MDHGDDLAAAILPSLPPRDVRHPGALALAIRTQLLREALEDCEQPRTVADLLHVLERTSRGEVGAELVFGVRVRAAAEPGLLLTQLATRACDPVPARSTAPDPDQLGP